MQTELRSQDIHLMKQLFNINNAIRQITKDRLCQHVKPCLGYKEHLTKRQLSLSQYVLQERQIMDSTSSTEGWYMMPIISSRKYIHPVC